MRGRAKLSFSYLEERALQAAQEMYVMEALRGWHTWAHKQALPLAHARTHTHTRQVGDSHPRAGSQAQLLPAPPPSPIPTNTDPLPSAWFYSILTTGSVGALLGVLEVGGSPAMPDGTHPGTTFQEPRPHL